MGATGRSRRTTAARAAAEAALLMLVLAAPARAASVEVVADCWKNDCFEHASFVAAPGERNRVVVSHDSGRVVTLADTGAPLTLGEGCVALSEHRARCTADPDALDDLTAKVWLGDGDDTARLDRGHVYGGPGDDRLSGARVSLTGGPGKDRLTATVAGALTDGDGAHPAQAGHHHLASGGQVDDLGAPGLGLLALDRGVQHRDGLEVLARPG